VELPAGDGAAAEPAPHPAPTPAAPDAARRAPGVAARLPSGRGTART
jgi:hypothetical protein